MTVGLQTTLGNIETPPAPARRFTVDEYHCMIRAGVFDTDNRVELLNGWILKMPPHGPPHDTSVLLTESTIERCLPPGWVVREQSSITLSDSEPEPDVAVVRGDARSFSTRHPTPADVGLLAEVAESSLRFDRMEKGPIYAREGIFTYWIVNLTEFKIEVYSDLTPTGYRQRRDYGVGESVPLVLDGRQIAQIPVQDLLP